MDAEDNLQDPPEKLNNNNLVRAIETDSDFSGPPFPTPSSSSQDLLRQVQAAFKRHRPLGTVQSNMRPMRTLVPQRKISKNTALNEVSEVGTKNGQEGFIVQRKNIECAVGETQQDASITLPSSLGTITSTHVDKFKGFDIHINQARPVTDCKNTCIVSSSVVDYEHVPLADGQKKVHFSMETNVRSHEMKWDMSNPVDAQTDQSHEIKHSDFQRQELDMNLRASGSGISSLEKETIGIPDQLEQFGNFLSDLNHPTTQSSVIGSSCVTTTLINSASAPMLNSTTYDSHPHQMSNSNIGIESSRDYDMKPQPTNQQDEVHPSYHSSKYITGALADKMAIAAKPLIPAVNSQLENKEYDMPKEPHNSEQKESDIAKYPSPDDKPTNGKNFAGDKQSHDPLSKIPSTDVKQELSKSEKQDKVGSGKAIPAPRKKSYDPDLFFKVNGKLYQRLGKIGSGGSSEVHKVISSDCTIYALKRIKLKGRDYATAFGFCQEIEYLNKLKGKNNIIQLIDYEVTDKNLLREVMNGSMCNKDGKLKEDGYIYMVLEYGEIDLAHMLSQKWRELDSCNSTIDENWLRFYWQQILLAVNTIHEERIVHSDLKPANFLLVRGSLKLIDFGIAKAIMSDTTNIQRDSQVGTLSYMSPEAFMCNETDANGNTIKCGRPSDIWSLGCILYQMVYGRTPFSEYKTFWAKFKVITNPNYEITFEPVPNPWLLDLMRKCLAWDRNERWRIPQLLQHPFLVPPIPSQNNFEMIHVLGERCSNDQKALNLFFQLQQQLLRCPRSTSNDHLCKVLCEMSNICFRLQEQLGNSDSR